MSQLARRAVLAGAAALVAPTPRLRAADAPSKFTIGYQKNGDLLVVKEQGRLAQRLARDGVTLDWVEFQSGPPLLEALNAGSVDFGATGDTPPIFAQAAGANLVYVGYVPVPGTSSAVVVPKDSPIKTLADLKGKRVAFTKGSSAHNVIVQVLARAGLGYGDITPVYLQPPDAAAAFEQGSVDAWSIWDPFYAIAVMKFGARVLTTAEGIAPSNSFFLANRDYAGRAPKVVAATVDEIDAASQWEKTHQDEQAVLFAKATGVELAVETVAAARGNYGVHFLTPAVIAQQQAIADTFFKLGLIPKQIDVSSIVWTPRT